MIPVRGRLLHRSGRVEAIAHPGSVVRYRGSPDRIPASCAAVHETRRYSAAPRASPHTAPSSVLCRMTRFGAGHVANRSNSFGVRRTAWPLHGRDGSGSRRRTRRRRRRLAACRAPPQHGLDAGEQSVWTVVQKVVAAPASSAATSSSQSRADITTIGMRTSHAGAGTTRRRRSRQLEFRETRPAPGAMLAIADWASLTVRTRTHAGQHVRDQFATADHRRPQHTAVIRYPPSFPPERHASSLAEHVNDSTTLSPLDSVCESSRGARQRRRSAGSTCPALTMRSSARSKLQRAGRVDNTRIRVNRSYLSIGRARSESLRVSASTAAVSAPHLWSARSPVAPDASQRRAGDDHAESSAR